MGATEGKFRPRGPETRPNPWRRRGPALRLRGLAASPPRRPQTGRRFFLP